MSCGQRSIRYLAEGKDLGASDGIPRRRIDVAAIARFVEADVCGRCVGHTLKRWGLLVSLLAAVTGCGGGSGPTHVDPPTSPTPPLSFAYTGPAHWSADVPPIREGSCSKRPRLRLLWSEGNSVTGQTVVLLLCDSMNRIMATETLVPSNLRFFTDFTKTPPVQALNFDLRYINSNETPRGTPSACTFYPSVQFYLNGRRTDEDMGQPVGPGDEFDEQAFNRKTISPFPKSLTLEVGPGTRTPVGCTSGMPGF